MGIISHQINFDSIRKVYMIKFTVNSTMGCIERFTGLDAAIVNAVRC